jgi:hypothetical protein
MRFILPGYIPQYDICSASGSPRLVSPISCHKKNVETAAHPAARQANIMAVQVKVTIYPPVCFTLLDQQYCVPASLPSA